MTDYQRWSDEKTQWLKAEVAAGHSANEISHRWPFGGYCSPPRIRSKCLREHLELDPDTSWTPERTERARTLWLEGRSAGQIANELGGITRNGVIGKVHRMKLEPRAKPAPRKPRRVRRQKLTIMSEPPLKPVILEVAPEQPSLGIPIAELQGYHCRWIPFDDRLHCGHPKMNGFSYCAFHSRIAYRLG